MKIAAIAPVLNECPWIGYSIMAALPGIDSMHYGIDGKSNDGTFELVKMLSETAGKDKVFWYRGQDFDIDVTDKHQYENAFNVLIECAKSTKPDAILYLHPDMIITNPEQMARIDPEPVAWYTHIRSFAKNLTTEITKGRALTWKNMHCPRFGLKYVGAYGTLEEDFYHHDITGNSYKHYGEEYSKYPFRVADSGLRINHYCEVKPYRRRLEKMKTCLKVMYPQIDDYQIKTIASNHPRVTLEPTPENYLIPLDGKHNAEIKKAFVFEPTQDPIPEVFDKYRKEFESFKKEPALVH